MFIPESWPQPSPGTTTPRFLLEEEKQFLLSEKASPPLTLPADQPQWHPEVLEASSTLLTFGQSLTCHPPAPEAGPLVRGPVSSACLGPSGWTVVETGPFWEGPTPRKAGKAAGAAQRALQAGGSPSGQVSWPRRMAGWLRGCLCRGWGVRERGAWSRKGPRSARPAVSVRLPPA